MTMANKKIPATTSAHFGLKSSSGHSLHPSSGTFGSQTDLLHVLTEVTPQSFSPLLCGDNGGSSNHSLRAETMSEEKILTKKIAEQFLEDEYSVRLSGYEKLDDDAADVLRRHTGRWLILRGLTELSDAAAESLSKRPGHLSLNGLTKITDSAAEHLSKHEGGVLWLNGLNELSDAAAESLSKHEGCRRRLLQKSDRSIPTSLAYTLHPSPLPETGLSLYGLKFLSDAAAESLSKRKDELYLKGLTSLSDAAAESLSKHKGYLYLKGLTSLSDAAAESLSKHKGGLNLGGLTELSDAAAESLSKCEGNCEVDLNDLPASAAQIFRDAWFHLSQEIAQQFLKDEDSVNLDDFTSIEDAAAKSFSEYEGYLSLDGLTSLSDAAAESLSKHKGNLSLDGLTELSDAAAESLSKHKDELSLNGLTKLSDAAAESLSKHKGSLSLDGLTELSDAAAESLSQCREISRWHAQDQDWGTLEGPFIRVVCGCCGQKEEFHLPTFAAGEAYATEDHCLEEEGWSQSEDGWVLCGDCN